MKGKDWLLLGGATLAIYLLTKKKEEPANIVDESINAIVSLPGEVAQGIATPGGLLGKDSLTDTSKITEAISNAVNSVASFPAQVAQGIATSGGLLGKDSVTDIPSQVASIVSLPGEVAQGIATPGGLLGKDSLTDIGFQINNLLSPKVSVSSEPIMSVAPAEQIAQLLSPAPIMSVAPAEQIAQLLSSASIASAAPTAFQEAEQASIAAGLVHLGTPIGTPTAAPVLQAPTLDNSAILDGNNVYHAAEQVITPTNFVPPTAILGGVIANNESLPENQDPFRGGAQEVWSGGKQYMFDRGQGIYRLTANPVNYL